MPVTDPIADMLTRVRNAVAVGHERVAMPSSKMKVGIAQILVDEGYIDRYEVSEDVHRRFLELVLRYGDRRRPAIEGIKASFPTGSSRLSRFQRATPCSGWPRCCGCVHQPGTSSRP